MDRSYAPAILSFSILIIATIGVWRAVLASSPSAYEIAFLDVGQGDSQLIQLPGPVQILVDTGPSGAALIHELGTALPRGDRTIDLVIITHPEYDHYGGLRTLLEHYDIRAFAWNGLETLPNDSPEWKALLALMDTKSIPRIPLQRGDAIHIGDAHFFILSPDPLLVGSSGLNDTSLVQKVETPTWSALLTGDIGESVENYLVSQFDLRADILKVGHHGSKFSSSEPFLQAVLPRIAVIQAGANNRHGHPAPETLNRLEALSLESLLRTDSDGTIRIGSGEY